MANPIIARANLRAVLFDLDGTLLDSFAVHCKIYEAMFAKFDIQITKHEFMRCYSPNWCHTYQAVGLPKESWGLADAYWLEEATKHEPALFPGAKDALLQISARYALGLVTSGSKSRVLRDLKRTGIVDHFQVIVTGDDVQEPKPSPEGLRRALENLGVHSNEAIYVGDTPADYEMARGATVGFIGVSSQFLRSGFDHQYHLVESISDLIKVILND